MPLHQISEKSSDLLDIVHHEHAHLRRLFEDLSQKFDALASGRVKGEERREVILSASEDLSVALEDMLHHFNQEEEVFFVELEERFPELKERIEKLVRGHEEMSQRMRWLQEQLMKPPESLGRDVVIILDVVQSMARLVEEHTDEETELFELALKSVPDEERQEMLEKMRQI